ncbi:hypothetical protein FE784_35665 [Paenibacillus hemerocallicola]|uniref:Uncharacterized protein n=1 Tax=Paenibacillus hemerocallicola TaxID=1172614 RepID=A0A5C4SZR5_9BACL|nr:hypothetical protein [Paenibacillus hemerocallicola]TNJ60682.1 hypothetical protein FE784_35665 [Paenibacillus hemerocallicola]
MADTIRRDQAAEAVERAHRELWRRFVLERDDYGIVLDYAGLDGFVTLPTPEECADGKPNALAWWCPAENGAFFNGLYIDGLLNRWRTTGDERDRGEVEKIALGLMRLAEIADRPGFVARGIADDGKSHHALGSDDQTAPWFYGLWKYWQSGLPGPDMRSRIVGLFAAAGDRIETLGWRIPCDREQYTFRGSWAEGHFIHAARVLFMLKLMGVLTDDPKWDRLYRKVGEEIPEGSDKSRFQWCGFGIRDNSEYWTSASSQACLRELYELEDDPDLKRMYKEGLETNARRALAYIREEANSAYDNDNALGFESDWRFLNEWWEPQATVEDALRVAGIQSRQWHGRSPRKAYEAKYVREPLFAAWFVVLSGDGQLVLEAGEPIRRLLTQYEWEKLYYSLFFMAECVYYEGVRCGL